MREDGGFTNWAEVVATANGAYGDDDLKERALDLLEEHGLLDEDGTPQLSPEQMAARQQWVAEGTAQLRQIEEMTGHKLSRAEEKKLTDFHGPTTEPPDFVGTYGAAIGRDLRNKDDRQALGAEIYREHQEQIAADAEDLT